MSKTAEVNANQLNMYLFIFFYICTDTAAYLIKTIVSWQIIFYQNDFTVRKLHPHGESYGLSALLKCETVSGQKWDVGNSPVIGSSFSGIEPSNLCIRSSNP